MTFINSYGKVSGIMGASSSYRWVIVGLALVLLARIVETTSGAVIIVPANYPSIQQAVQNCNPGDTIQVEPGYYFEKIIIPFNKNDITIRGNGAVTLVGGFVINAPSVTIEKLRVTGGYWISQYGLQPNAFTIPANVTGVTLRNNLIENIPGRPWEVSAMATSNANYFKAESNVVRYTEKTAYVNNPCDGLLVRYNYFEGRYCTFDNDGNPGLNNALYEYNTFVGTELGETARMGMNNTSSFNKNNFFACQLGIMWRFGATLNATNNWWGTTNGPLDPLGSVEISPGDPHPGAAQLLNAQPSGQLGARVIDLSGTVFLNGSANIDYYPWAMAPISNGYQFPGPAEVWVSTQYSAAASNDGHLWGVNAFSNIQEGIDAVWTGMVWVLDGTYRLMEPIWIAKNITVKSVNGPLHTIVDGGYPVVTSRCFYVNHTNAVLDGFTIRNGMAGGSDWPANNWGGGVYCPQGTIQNCIISNNVSGVNGGGVWMANSALLRNCLIIRNSALQKGGGVYIHSTTGIIQNCTIAFNGAGGKGGGICATNGRCQVENSIIYNNLADSGDNWSFPGTGTLGPHCFIRYSCSPDDLSAFGSGNITGDPYFLNPDENDFRLLAISPCLNTGTNASWMIPDITTDIIGHSRITDGKVDMGAYEKERPSGGAMLMVW